MDNNWLLIVVGVIFLIGLIIGLVRGAIKIAVSLLATVITFVLVFYATPYVSKALTAVTPLKFIVESQTEEIVKKMWNLEEQPGTSSVSDTGEDAEEVPRDVQISAIESSDMPDIFKSLLITNNNPDIYKSLGVESFVSYAATYLANLLIHLVSFVLTFLVITIILRAVIFSLDIIADLPGVGIVNRLAGGLLGMGSSLIVVWVLFLIITLLYALGVGKSIYELIESNDILSFLYDLNPVMKLATILK